MARAAAPAPEAWRNRIVGSGEAAPSELVANPDNWRTHPAPQRRALRGSLGTVGWVQQVLVNTRTGHVVDGHARLEEALERGEASVPVLYVDLSAEEEALILATLDPIGAMADTDDAKLRALLAEVSVDDVGLKSLLGALGRRRQGMTDPDDAPDLTEAPWVKAGELYGLGDHRLLVGDASDEADVARVTEGQEIDLLWTDPPYGVSYVGKTSEALTIENDRLTPEATFALVKRALELTPLKKGGAFYIASPAGPLYVEFALAVRGAGLRHAQNLVWVKNRFVLGRSDFHYRHEPILAGWQPGEDLNAKDHETLAYGWLPGEAHEWNGGRRISTVFEIDRPSRSIEHPTMKPVELVARAMEYSSEVGDRVYDPFAGSGTTIIAAEQLERRAVTLELDPRYAQVIIERWQAFTGRKAERIDG